MFHEGWGNADIGSWRQGKQTGLVIGGKINTCNEILDIFFADAFAPGDGLELVIGISMPIMFIPAAVGLLVSFQQLEAMFIPAVITVIVTTFVVSAVTGIVTQWVIRYERRREK